MMEVVEGGEGISEEEEGFADDWIDEEDDNGVVMKALDCDSMIATRRRRRSGRVMVVMAAGHPR